MPWNGSGVFTRLYSWVADRDNGIDITASRFDADEDDIVQGLMNCLTCDGQTVPTANLAMRGFRITGAGDGVNPGDYATIRQLSSGTFAASFASLSLPGTLTVSSASTLAAVTANSLSVSGTTTTQELTVNDRAAILEIDLGHSQSNRQGWFDGANGNGSLNGNFYVGGGLYVSGNRLNVYGGSSPGLALINTAGSGPFAVFNSSGNLGFGPADGNGNPTAFWGWFDGNGNFGLAHNLNVSGSAQLAHLSVSDEIYSTGNNAGFQFADRGASGQNWAWYATSGSARLWLGSDRMWVDSSGNLTTNGGATFNGYTTASDFRSNLNVYVPNGWVHAGTDLQAGTNCTVGQNLSVGGTAAVNGGRFVITSGSAPSLAIHNVVDGSTWGMWNASGNLQWGGTDGSGNPTQSLMRLDGGGSLWLGYGDFHVPAYVYAGNINCGGQLDVSGGTMLGGQMYPQTDNAINLGDLAPARAWSSVASYQFLTASDRSVKADITELPDDCLALVRSITPKRYRLAGAQGAEAQRVHWGFVAQDVGVAMAAAGCEFGGYVTAENGIEGLSYNQLLALLWRGVQELAAA